MTKPNDPAYARPICAYHTKQGIVYCDSQKGITYRQAMIMHIAGGVAAGYWDCASTNSALAKDIVSLADAIIAEERAERLQHSHTTMEG